MSFVRPEVARALERWREVLVGAAAILLGLWIAGLGGLVLATIGGILAAAAAALTLIAWRRMRFRVAVEAPGLVEIDEGRISYMGPVFGGSVSLEELVEIEVLDVAGTRRCWRLRQSDGQALLVPLASAGAERLYDHFAGLPGIDARRLMSAVKGEAGLGRTIWRRPARQGLISTS